MIINTRKKSFKEDIKKRRIRMSKDSKIKYNLQFLNDYMFIRNGMKPSCTYHQLHFVSRKDFSYFVRILYVYLMNV